MQHRARCAAHLLSSCHRVPAHIYTCMLSILVRGMQNTTGSQHLAPVLIRRARQWPIHLQSNHPWQCHHRYRRCEQAIANIPGPASASNLRLANPPCPELHCLGRAWSWASPGHHSAWISACNSRCNAECDGLFKAWLRIADAQSLPTALLGLVTQIDPCSPCGALALGTALDEVYW